MQLKRFPSHAQFLRARRLKVAALFAALAALIALIGWIWATYRLWFEIGALFVVAEVPWFLKKAGQAAQGDKGEARAIEALQSLDDRYTLVTNWVPEEGKGDVDLLLLGPHGA